MVPAPAEHVQVHRGGVGELDEEQLLGRDLVDGRQIAAARQDVEAVQADPERRVVGGFDHAPRVVVRRHEPPPRQGLVRDPHPVVRGDAREHLQLLGGESVVVDRRRPDVRADEHRVDAEPVHQLELVACSLEGSGEALGGRAFDVAEGLIQVEREPEIGRPLADVLG